MAVQSTRNNSAVHQLVRLSSQGDYAIVDQQASQVLRDSHQHHGTRLFELYQTTKRILLSGSAAQRHRHTAPAVASDPYDTSDWEDPGSDSEYIVAQSIANLVSYYLIHVEHGSPGALASLASA